MKPDSLVLELMPGLGSLVYQRCELVQLGLGLSSCKLGQEGLMSLHLLWMVRLWMPMKAKNKRKHEDGKDKDGGDKELLEEGLPTKTEGLEGFGARFWDGPPEKEDEEKEEEVQER